MEHTRILESALREFNLRYEEEEEHIIKFASHSRLSYFKKFHLFGILGHKFLQDPSEHVHRHNLCLFVVKLKSQTPLLNGIFVHTIELIEGEKVGRVHKPPRKVLNFKNIFLLLNHCTCFFLFLLIKLFALVKITFLPSIKLQRKI